MKTMVIQTRTKKWVEVTAPEDFPDSRTIQRVLIGRMTRRRYRRIRRIMRKLINRHPYGKGYRCGHDHDCCGCTLGTYAGLEFRHYMGGFKIIISQTESFNY